MPMIEKRLRKMPLLGAIVLQETSSVLEGGHPTDNDGGKSYEISKANIDR